MAIEPGLIDWLLEADPAVRWQTMRDLTDASAGEIASTRALVARQGIAAQILHQQQPDGSWHHENEPVWLATLAAMQLLRITGVDPTDPAVEAAMQRLEDGVRWNDQQDYWELRERATGGNTFFEGEVDPCINGNALAAGAYFKRPAKALAEHMLRDQLPDGGWNCEAPPSTCASFHSTICVLEGLLEYERATGRSTEITAARQRAEQYLLERSLFRRLSTGEPACPEFLESAFPPRYHYDILRALDYLRAAEAAPKDPRLTDAIAILRSKRLPDGRWPLDARYDEALPITLDENVGQPSRWNTLRALRVLRWYEQSA